MAPRPHPDRSELPALIILADHSGFPSFILRQSKSGEGNTVMLIGDSLSAESCCIHTRRGWKGVHSEGRVTTKPFVQSPLCGL